MVPLPSEPMMRIKRINEIYGEKEIEIKNNFVPLPRGTVAPGRGPEWDRDEGVSKATFSRRSTAFGKRRM
jgi:hypothetical protein